ncbi:hypothetical protein MLD38_014674 [Melastoma candidum]|uniref:Uncharacterized protein n=1 Tax=Melastoma candidum TaxID=119954 RepID=A0ACB9RDI9_9MYRT|nr:hypothetical protein MLD38_014674 [Melastoma candidum]
MFLGKEEEEQKRNLSHQHHLLHLSFFVTKQLFPPPPPLLPFEIPLRNRNLLPEETVGSFPLKRWEFLCPLAGLRSVRIELVSGLDPSFEAKELRAC